MAQTEQFTWTSASCHDQQLCWGKRFSKRVRRQCWGKKVEAASGKRSTFSLRDGRRVSIRYNEADMKLPIASVSEATQKVNWFVFGPGKQSMIAHHDGERGDLVLE